MSKENTSFKRGEVIIDSINPYSQGKTGFGITPTVTKHAALNKSGVEEVKVSHKQNPYEAFDSFTKVMSAKARFYRLGFNEGEIVRFTARQPSVYLKALESLEKVFKEKDLIDSIRKLPEATGYRRERLEKHLEPLGEFTKDFLKDVFKHKTKG